MPPSEICDYVRPRSQVCVLCHKHKPATVHQPTALHALFFERQNLKKLSCSIFPSASFSHVIYSFLIFSHLCYLLAEATCVICLLKLRHSWSSINGVCHQNNLIPVLIIATSCFLETYYGCFIILNCYLPY